jgi:hypothetical protein
MTGAAAGETYHEQSYAAPIVAAQYMVHAQPSHCHRNISTEPVEAATVHGRFAKKLDQPATVTYMPAGYPCLCLLWL